MDIPFCVAGGIRSAHEAEKVLNAGAEKISINSPALENPGLIDVLSSHFGSQCVVVGIDSRRTRTGWRAWQFSGDPDRARDSGRSVSDWVTEVQDRGAGEIVLNCMDVDGVREGYDLKQISRVRAQCHIPLVASGGAGHEHHFLQVFAHGADAALAASVFHSGAIGIGGLKHYLRSQGVEVRL
jgi:imidazole glycerol-phosphate synthase subunit HisF